MANLSQPDLAALRRLLAQPGHPRSMPPLRLDEAINRLLPGGGLARGALHEVAGGGAEIEHAAAAVLFVATILAGQARTEPIPVLWVAARNAIHAPALAGAGLHPDRVIYAEASRPAAVLLAMEDALGHSGLAGVVGELAGRLSLTASRRLQLAAEASGTVAFLLRRSNRFDDPAFAEPCAAVTRWRVESLPSAPPLPAQPAVRGLGRARWRLDLLRCRGGNPATWIVEAPDAQGRLGVPADLADRPAASQRLRGAA